MSNKVLAVVGLITGAIAGGLYAYHKDEEKYEKMRIQADRNMAMYRLMNEWIKVKQEGGDIGRYLIDNGYRHIAIYGMGYIGEILLGELKNSEVEVLYAIDKGASDKDMGIKVVSPEGELHLVDAIIVTPFNAYETIEEALSQRVDCPILSIDDVIFDM